MDTIIAIGIIAVAGIFVIRRIYAQMKAKQGGGCGCSGGCGPECGGKGAHHCDSDAEKGCSCDK